MESNSVPFDSFLGASTIGPPPSLLVNKAEMAQDHDASYSRNNNGEAVALGIWPQPSRTLNAIGLSCPMPLLRAQKEIVSLSSRQILEVQSTCPGARTSLPAWSERAGHSFLGAWEEDGVLRSFIQKQ